MPTRRIHANFIFSPNWWAVHHGVSFDEPFYLDAETRTANDVLMRRVLWERFQYGAPDPQPRPILGSRHIAGGYAVPGLLGVTIRFGADQAAWPLPIDLSREAAMALRVPDLKTTWPTSVLIPQIEKLLHQHGYVTGDLNPGGLLNTCIELRGQQFFIDLVEDAELCDHLLDVVSRTQIAVCQLVRGYSGTAAVSVNRSVLDANPALALTSNCSTHMINPALYEKRILPFEQRLAAALQPFGVHHCGNNLHRYAPIYSTFQSRFFDVGWGSDVASVAAQLPHAFLNLRLNPVRIMNCTADEAYTDAITLLRASGRSSNVGVCCINMDTTTPDANVLAIQRAARDYEQETAS